MTVPGRAKSVKMPKILSISKNDDHWLYDDEHTERESTFSVKITLRALRSLPLWVQAHLHWAYCMESNVHCDMQIGANDELEAMLRFKKLWAALPKEGE